MSNHDHDSDPAPKFSRHTNEQHRWREALISALGHLDDKVRACKLTQAYYLNRREQLYAVHMPRLTEANREYCRGYERALSDARWRGLRFFYRFPGRPETAEAANWDTMSEAMRESCRTRMSVEGAHCWDDRGQFPWGPWSTL